ncbi:hypothetical protein ACHAXA_007624 [Cyclostephanos tholiformis]|uniref:Uncharacterized protein n=1 Tax=Cyclostephanos tholiformis TaxID=382380 RepID=A0ABD3R6Z3_9STRA
MNPNDREWRHGGGHGGQGSSGYARPYHTSDHNNGAGYNGGGIHPRNNRPGNQHPWDDGGDNRHPRSGSFIIDRGGVRGNNDPIYQYGHGVEYGGRRGNNDRMNHYNERVEYGGVRGNNDRMNQYGQGGGYGGVRGNNDRMNRYNERGRDMSDRGGEVNGTKRLASSSPDQRSDAVPMEILSAAVESILSTAVESVVLTNDDLTEEERANRKVFEDCLRDIDKVLPVWKLAHQLPRDRWNEKEGERETWNQREKNAVDATIKSIGEDLLSGRISRPWQKQNECDGSSSSDDSYPPRASHQKTSPRDLSQMEKRFINALPHCLPLNRGFHLTEFGASEICYCPCGPNVEPWREKNNIVLDYDCKQKKRFQPNDLMDHLRKEGGVYEEKEKGKKVMRDLSCMFHHATEVYLRILYKDWHGTDFPHKALFPRLSKEYRRADDEDSRLRLRDLEFANREIKRHEEEKEKDRAEMEKKDKEIAFFRNQSKDHLERLQELEKIRERFQVVTTDNKDKLTEGQLIKYERMMIDYFDTMKQVYGICKDGVVIEVTSTKDGDEWLLFARLL